MKSAFLWTLVALVLLATAAHADCQDGAATKNPDDGDVTSWIKNFGCQIKKGAEKAQESAKPYTVKITETAKEFGNTVAQKYDEIKHKLTDEPKTDGSNKVEAKHVDPAPAEKVPLAPLAGELPARTAK